MSAMACCHATRASGEVSVRFSMVRANVTRDSTLAMVFQRPHLLPWRTVLDNATYGLECRGRLDDSARERAREAVRTA